ncbi:hypothetical protein DAPPUDRAFT_220501 [Daphnia pulex]|uniref:Bestrophin homolog n=1 Tax=Daphnia pulex TaxID=6669 RepID=E9FTF1_DAPPU|nr:hypothetical protein DAPPUDRAFT_220501 [Daphnia pulex]|eukprot:EFX89350.1 hypothetical protein DAPPUDRAFT_220501 [Daphnia pulex]
MQKHSNKDVNVNIGIEAEESIQIEGVSATATKFGESLRGIFRWRQSFFKLVWKQAIIYYLIYVSITLFYAFALDTGGQANFDAVASYLARYTSSLPVVLLLGFFTSTALNRWFNIMSSMPGTNRAITLFVVSLKDDVADGRARVDLYIRYVLLMWLLTFRIVCQPLRRRYPNLMAIQNAGLLCENERLLLEKHKGQPGGTSRTCSLVVYDWLNALLRETSQKGYFLVANDFGRNIDAIQALKKGGGTVIKFATKNIPVALIQAVTIAIYCYGLVSILSHQIAEKHYLTSVMSGYFPLPYALPFFFYYAWLKVGRIATDPFGNDEDDINMLNVFEGHINGAVRLRNSYGIKIPTSTTEDNPFFLT